MNVPTTTPTPLPPRRRSAVMRAFLAFVAAIGLIAGATALPASAASPTSYIGLGDSIAAGTGGGTYTDLSCLQTAAAYPTQLHGTNLGCFGAKTGNVQTQAGKLNGSVKTVTVTVGANDVGVGNVAAVCMTQDAASCQSAISDATVALQYLPGKLTATIATVRANAPNARITFTGYPLLFTVSGLPPAQQTVAAEINAATALLNATIAGTVLANGALYTDVTWRFLGHGYGSPSPWINGPISTPTGLDPSSFHPNYAGYTYGYVPAVRPFVS